MVIVALRDSVADRFLSVQLEENTKTACRGFVFFVRSVLDDRSNFLINNPEDFSIVKICDFDPESGLISNNEPVILMNGFQAIKDIDRQPIPFEDINTVFDEEGDV